MITGEGMQVCGLTLTTTEGRGGRGGREGAGEEGEGMARVACVA